MELVNFFIEMLQERRIAYGQIFLFTIELGIQYREQMFGRLDRWVVASGHISA